MRENPFQPHAVANAGTGISVLRCDEVYRQSDCLGDSLFRQDTIETINEATQIYVLAANLLGPKPQRIPPRGTTKPKTFALLRRDLDSWGMRWSIWKEPFLLISISRRLRVSTPIKPMPSSASAGRFISASPATTSSSAIGILWPTGSSKSATA